MTNEYEIRPHHCFKGWVLIFKNGVSIGARVSRLEAEQWIARDKHIQEFKRREIRL